MQKAFVGFVGGLLGFFVSSDVVLADDTQQYTIQQCHLFDIQSLSHGVADFYDQFFFHGFFVFIETDNITKKASVVYETTIITYCLLSFPINSFFI